MTKQIIKIRRIFGVYPVLKKNIDREWCIEMLEGRLYPLLFWPFLGKVEKTFI